MFASDKRWISDEIRSTPVSAMAAAVSSVIAARGFGERAPATIATACAQFLDAQIVEQDHVGAGLEHFAS